MPISTACSSCSAKIKVKDELLGKSIKCPKCAKVFKVAADGAGQRSAVKPAAAGAKPAPKKPAPAWGDDEGYDDEKASPWADKKKPGKAKSRNDEEEEDKEEKPKGKPKPPVKGKNKGDDEDDDDEDAEKGDGDQNFQSLLAQTLLPDSTKKMIQSELSLRERGIWVGQPDLKIMTVRAIPKFIIGAVIVTILAIMLGVGGGFGIGEHPWIGPVVAGLLWILLIPVMAIAIPLLDRRKAKGTAYVITNKRCICFYGSWFGGPSQESYYPDLLQHMRRMQSWFFGGDAGDIVFRSVTTITTTTDRQGRRSTSSSTVYYGFLGIRNLDAVENMIRRTLLGAGGGDDDKDDDDDDDD